MSLSVRSEILGLSVNTITAADKYSRHNSENLQTLIQIQLSKKPKSFGEILTTFSKYTGSLEHFEKKLNLTASVFSKLLTPKDVVT